MADTVKTKEDVDLIYGGLNTIGAALKAPGKWFEVNSYGFSPGIVFMGIVGSLLAFGFIYLGIK